MTTGHEAPPHPASRAHRFATALADAGGSCEPVAGIAAAREAAERWCGSGAVTVHRDPLLDQVTDGLRQIADPWDAEVGVTGALAAVADTGSLAMAYDRDHPRGTSLVPPRHLAVVPVSLLVDSYADAIDLLAALRPVPSGMQLITGPSGSGDIEMVHVRGMHGPLAVHVVLLTDH